MNEPIQVLCVARPLPDLATSPYGPFVLHPAADLADAGRHLAEQALDALLVHWPEGKPLAGLMQWADLPRVVPHCAVVVLAREASAADTLRLVQQGVQDVLPWPDTQAERLASALRQAVERKRLEVSARKAFSTDLGTGLPNQAQLLEHMSHLLALREREPAAMALLVLRMHGLAGVQAQLGAEACNVLRRKVAVRLRSGLRASDVVASLGTDTFAVLLAWMLAADDAVRVAAKLTQLLRRPYRMAGQEVALAVSVGVARYPEQGKQAQPLLHHALAQAQDAQPLGRMGDAAANDEA